MTVELKPCPFCGGEAMKVECGMYMQLCFFRCDICTAETSAGTEVEAVEAWNRRAAGASAATAPELPVDPDITQLKGLIRSLQVSINAAHAATGTRREETRAALARASASAVEKQIDLINSRLNDAELARRDALSLGDLLSAKARECMALEKLVAELSEFRDAVIALIKSN